MLQQIQQYDAKRETTLDACATVRRGHHEKGSNAIGSYFQNQLINSVIQRKSISYSSVAQLLSSLNAPIVNPAVTSITGNAVASIYYYFTSA